MSEPSEAIAASSHGRASLPSRAALTVPPASAMSRPPMPRTIICVWARE